MVGVRQRRIPLFVSLPPRARLRAHQGDLVVERAR